MRLTDLLKNVCAPPFDAEIAGIACDSRRVESGFAFVCIDGVEVDGHRYAPQAIENGATVLITQRDLGLPAQIIVPDTRAAWGVMSANWFGHPDTRLRMIGVTGTNGKTSTTYMLKHVLEECGRKVGLIGTIQSMIGQRPIPACHTTPEAYELQSLLAQMADEGCDDVVMEVSSHALAQCRVEAISFDAGIFTNLTQDHLDFHKTMENYAEAKHRLFQKSRLSVLNADDPWKPVMAADLHGDVVTFSAAGADGATYTASDIRYEPGGVDFLVTGPTEAQSGRIRIAIPGEFTVYNALGTLSCLLALGVPFDKAQHAFATLGGVKGRAEVVPTGRGFSVVIDYAHTPDGLEKICSTLARSCKGHLITVFGAAGERDRGKRPDMGRIAAKYSDLLVITSDNPRREDPMSIIREVASGVPDDMLYLICPNRFEAIRTAVCRAQPDDIVLLAGKGHETYQVLKNGIIHLDEREEVAKALGMKNKWELGQ
ncbi:MAG: UDP-N-acetylmuramoyl-L-alanyl-D-glutamate--2,6-diaminopimelate ligase [Clostridia bacterium]|nr:UDP-N-acetylmuramoyl-L-alanyl-D-glutamate--2,6-diaminopimelate ligase [Clostridia bacterium]